MNAPAVKTQSSRLDGAQARIDATRFGALTLDPDREIATALPELVESLAEGPLRDAMAAAAVAVAEAQLENFPDNIFWDFDRFLGALCEQASQSSDPGAHLARAADTTVRLMRLYGQRSRIRFRYVHDFTYGFDWARWVRRDPTHRVGSDPFGVSFLDQAENRGKHILELIDADDHFYSRLKDGASRNPFPFSREPEDELQLYRDLSARGLIPVEAWRIDGRIEWNRNFDDLRKLRAEALGLGRN